MRWALDYWGAQKVGQALPSKQLIDVTDFPKRLLPMLFLLEHIEEKSEYVMRLAGTAYRQIYGREITGLSVGDLLQSDAGANLKNDLERARKSATPVFLDSVMTWPPTSALVAYQRLLLPYSGETGGALRFFLGVARVTDPQVALRS